MFNIKHKIREWLFGEELSLLFKEINRINLEKIRQDKLIMQIVFDMSDLSKKIKIKDDINNTNYTQIYTTSPGINAILK